MPVIDESTIRYLNYLVKSYEGLTKLLAATRQRVRHINPEMTPENDDLVQRLEKLKGRLGRQIGKQLVYWPLWSEWLEKVPGIGPGYAGRLIFFHYYRMEPVCQKCGGDLRKAEGGMHCAACGQTAAGDGILSYRIGRRHFPKVSSWWHFMGMHVVDGKKPKRAKGQLADWSTPGRTLCHLIGQQFVKTPGHYRDFYDLRRARREKTHPDASKGHRHNMAAHETAKLFLAHLWHVARVLDGKEPTRPYAHTVMGHTQFIAPFYFEP